MFKVARTFDDPELSQSGFPTPGSGEQQTGPAVAQPRPDLGPPVRPTKGFRSWFNTLMNGGAQRGFPQPDAEDQQRPPGSMPNRVPVFGNVAYNLTPDMDRGASAFVPITGKVLYNPIGAGIPVSHRPQASYGPAAQYADGAIWWSTQQIPTSVNLQGLASPQELAALLNNVEIQAVVRTTG